ncbi:MAG: T9SS type B sorting domain-containing protein [Paludibacteraceae bacterium]|nr:T9SS type B sorting domain-containing protein [Paludibacteraceae bacterium]
MEFLRKILVILSILIASMYAFAITCESEYSFTINVTQSITENYTDAVCKGSDYSKYGFDIKNLQKDTICHREEDCNTYTLHLTVCEQKQTNLFESICEGSTFTKYGFSESKGGIYTQNKQTTCGCDSTVTLHLDVISNATTTLFDKFCVNEGYNGRGFTDIYAKKDTVLQREEMKQGCPSHVQLFLTACYPETTSLADTVQRGVHYTKYNFDLYTYSDTIAVQNLKTVQGCDSTVTLSLLVYHDYLFEENKSICRGDSLFWQNKYYKNEGDYEARYKSIYKMDSVYVLHLSYDPDYFIEEYRYVNQGTSFMWHGREISDAGEYYDSLKTVNGCDSIHHLTVALKYEIVIPPFFTPDGDGLNDTWVIKNLECYPGSTVEIFDRYNRRVAFYKDDVNSWDGLYNGHPLPSDDYWYVIRMADTGIKHSGHFILKRGKHQ